MPKKYSHLVPWLSFGAGLALLLLAWKSQGTVMFGLPMLWGQACTTFATDPVCAQAYLLTNILWAIILGFIAERLIAWGLGGSK